MPNPGVLIMFNFSNNASDDNFLFGIFDENPTDTS